MDETPASVPPPQSSLLDRLVQQYKDNKKSSTHPLIQAGLVKDMRGTGIAQADLARKLDERESTISELLKFAAFSEPAHRTFLAKNVSYSSLREISGLNKDDQTRLAGEIEAGTLPVQKIPGRVKDMKKEREAAAASRPTAGPQPQSEDGDLPQAVLSEKKGSAEVPRSADAPAPAKKDAPAAPGYPLIRDTLNHFEELCAFWRKTEKPQLGWLAERWLIYFGGKGWLKVGLVALVLGLAGVGAWQTVHYVWSQAGDFWYRFHTAFEKSGSGRAAPLITDHHTVTRHRLHLQWTSVPGALKYQVFWHSPDDKDISPVGGDVETLGAIVDIQPAHGKGYITVIGISAGDIPSPHSEKIAFVPTGENYLDSVWPLPPEEQGTPAAGGSPPTTSGMTGPKGPPGGNSHKGSAARSPSPNTSSPAGAGGGSIAPGSPTAPLVNANDVTQAIQAGLPQTGGIGSRLANAAAALVGKAVTPGGAATAGIPTVQGFQWERGLNGTIRLRWTSAGDGFRYTVYGAYHGPHPVFDVCFHPPTSATVFNWPPPTQGGKVYELYVVAVDAKGNEGLPSPHLIIDLRDSQ